MFPRDRLNSVSFGNGARNLPVVVASSAAIDVAPVRLIRANPSFMEQLAKALRPNLNLHRSGKFCHRSRAGRGRDRMSMPGPAFPSLSELCARVLRKGVATMARREASAIARRLPLECVNQPCSSGWPSATQSFKQSCGLHFRPDTEISSGREICLASQSFQHQRERHHGDVAPARKLRRARFLEVPSSLALPPNLC